jgi:hypothetical protein
MYRHILVKEMFLPNMDPYWKIDELYEADIPKRDFPFDIWILKTFNGKYGAIEGNLHDINDLEWRYYIDFDTEEDLLLFKLKTGL